MPWQGSAQWVCPSYFDSCGCEQERVSLRQKGLIAQSNAAIRDSSLASWKLLQSLSIWLVRVTLACFMKTDG